MVLKAQIYTAEGKMDKCMVSPQMEARSYVALEKTGGHGIAEGLDFTLGSNNLTVNKGTCYIFGYYIEIPEDIFVEELTMEPNRKVHWYVELNTSNTNTSTGKIEDGTYKVINNQVSIETYLYKMPLQSGNIFRLCLGQHIVNSSGSGLSYGDEGVVSNNKHLTISSKFRRKDTAQTRNEIQIHRNAVAYITTTLVATTTVSKGDVVCTLPDPFVCDLSKYKSLLSIPDDYCTYFQTDGKYFSVEFEDGSNEILFSEVTDGSSITSGTEFKMEFQIPVRIRGTYSDVD